jgi:hypothetical protein
MTKAAGFAIETPKLVSFSRNRFGFRVVAEVADGFIRC